MRLKKCAGLAAAMIVFSVGISAGQEVMAEVYKDVPDTHWAYAAVGSITDRGFMMGDITGNFNPNDFINKFDVSVTLAKAAGFRYSNLSDAEQAEYNAAYEANRDFISQFAAKYEKWNSSVNMEIAYLLHKGIYTKDDLSNFFRFVDNQDKLVALSKEQACVFLVRLMGKTPEADKAVIPASTLFKDDSAISSSSKPYVYYLKSLGIISGDSAGNFNPNNGATKAALAVMLYNTLELMPDLGVPDVPVENSNISEYITAQGVISRLYSSFRAIYMASPDTDFNNRIFPIAQDASIKIDGYVKSFYDLQQGMNFTCIVQKGEITAITALSNMALNASPENQAVQPASSQLETITLEGTVASHTAGEKGDSIEIELKLINPRGNIYTENRTYTLSNDCEIYRGENEVEFSNIASGDIVTLKVSGTVAYSVKLEEKNREINGVIIEKKINTLTDTPVIVVTDSNKKIYECAVKPSSSLKRNSSVVTNYNDLRVGDAVDIKLEYESILELSANGTKQTIDVWISEISISAKGSKITAIDSEGLEMTYQLIENTVDVYSLRIGSKVRLRLDSWEVETLSLLQEAKSDFETGFLYSIGERSIALSDLSGSSYNQKTFSYDSNTVIVDSMTGNRVSSLSLKNGMKLYVVYSETVSSYARTITILSY